MEEEPGVGWLALFERAWPSYRAWFLRDGEEARPDVRTSRAKLAEHMPELVGLWERLVELARTHLECDEDAELAARMLALYRPPQYLSGCSQAVWTHREPVLVRNYDYDPRLFEGTVMRTEWGGTRALAVSDCLWGALDGLNDHGLAVALAFGGRAEAGDGFGIPLILRYLLETCRTVDEAAATLRRVPSHMAYNVSLVDRTGAYAVAYLRPGHDTEVERAAVCTNHQPGSSDSDYARATRSVERAHYLRSALRSEVKSADELVDRFLEPPLFLTGYDRGYGTLYTVAYRAQAGEAEFRWRGARVVQGLPDFTERELVVGLG